MDKLKFIQYFIIKSKIIFLIYNINKEMMEYLFNLINYINRLYI